MNLPEHLKAKVQVWRKTKWLFIALLAPEVVSELDDGGKPADWLVQIVWTAFEQRREAKLVHGLVRRALRQSPKRTKWQKVHSILCCVFRRKQKLCEPDHEAGNLDVHLLRYKIHDSFQLVPFSHHQI